MDAPASKPLTTKPIEPGQVVEISVDLKAPSEIGSYRGDFKLRNENGVIFGIGNTAEPFWVEIDVESKSIPGALYDFTNKYCSSGTTWSNGAGTLPCPGKSGDSDGWVRRVDKPTLNRAPSMMNLVCKFTHKRSIMVGSKASIPKSPLPVMLILERLLDAMALLIVMFASS